MLNASWQLVIGVVVVLAAAAGAFVEKDPKSGRFFRRKWNPAHFVLSIITVPGVALIGFNGILETRSSKKAADEHAEQAKVRQKLLAEQGDLQSSLDALEDHERASRGVLGIWSDGSTMISSYLQCYQDTGSADFGERSRPHIANLVDLAKEARSALASMRSQGLLSILNRFVETEPEPFTQLDDAISAAERLLAEQDLSLDATLKVHSRLRGASSNCAESRRREVAECRNQIRAKLRAIREELESL